MYPKLYVPILKYEYDISPPPHERINEPEHILRMVLGKFETNS